MFMKAFHLVNLNQDVLTCTSRTLIHHTHLSVIVTPSPHMFHMFTHTHTHTHGSAAIATALVFNTEAIIESVPAE